MVSCQEPGVLSTIYTFECNRLFTELLNYKSTITELYEQQVLQECIESSISNVTGGKYHTKRPTSLRTIKNQSASGLHFNFRVAGINYDRHAFCMSINISTQCNGHFTDVDLVRDIYEEPHHNRISSLPRQCHINA